jgi:5'-nucleotidase
MIIAVDVDGVIADLMSAVLLRYNEDWKDSLTLSDLKGWNISTYVKPECGIRVFDYFSEPKLYETYVLPIDGAYAGMELLWKRGHRTIYPTKPSSRTEGIKFQWLAHYGFIFDRRDYIEMHDKSLLRADVLVDDGLHNLKDFQGERIIFDQPWNESGTVNGSFRAHGWTEVVKIINGIQPDRKLRNIL